jgi:flagellar motor switch protein FliM
MFADGSPDAGANSLQSFTSVLASALQRGRLVDSSALDPNELAAIRAAIAPSATPSRQAAIEASAADAQPVALIADDRAAESARPNGLRLGARWATTSRSALTRLCGVKPEIEVLAADTVDGSALRDELSGAWTRCITVTGRRGAALVAVSGPMIEALAACMLGATLTEQVGPTRPPSATSLRIFTPVGDSLVQALGVAWNEEQSCEVVGSNSAQAADTWRRELGDGDLVVVLTLEVKGAITGVVRLIARPELLVAPAVHVEAVAAPKSAIEEALGSIPVSLRVELGRLRMTLAEFAALTPGTVLTMDKFIDDPLPVRIGGRLKAWGRAVVARGAVAVEIVSIEKPGSKKHEE